MTTPPDPSEADRSPARGLRVRGARVHNLKGVDVDIPRDRLVVITGLSGSGKSSLAFDTIYAEGQRRYVESLSAYARQFLEQLAKPDVDSIDGLSPAVAIAQRASVRNPRSTVGTITEIHDYLRLLYARVGRVHCYQCGREITAQTVQQIVDRALELPTGARFTVVAPLVRGVRGKHRAELQRLRREGYVRVAVDGELVDLAAGLPDLDPRRPHSIDVHVDRLVAKPEIRQRLTDSVELALRLADGLVRIVVQGGADTLASERFACTDCGIAYPELSPRMFSFNSPHGACPTCDGLGVERFFAEDLVIGDTAASLSGGAVAPWSGSFRSPHYDRLLQAVCRHFDIDMDRPWRDLPAAQRAIVLRGHADPIDLGKAGRRPFAGVLADLEARWSASRSGDDPLEPFLCEAACRDCQGARLRRESRSVKVGGRTLAEVSALSVTEARGFFADLTLGPTAAEIAAPLLGEIGSRLGFLDHVGLGYLSLGRAAASLSGGEAQRIHLATQIGSALVGVLYVLDEPSIGLHPRDNDRLLEALRRLRDLGNTLLVVEHDAATIEAADYIIDMGPRAGVHGGEVVAQGSLAEILASEQSLTGQYLSGRASIPVPARRRKPRETVVVRGAREHNLKGIDVEFGIGVLTCVTGVSGSGKSTLVMDTLRPALERRLGRAARRRDGGSSPGLHDRLEGAHHIDRVIAIDQTPIGRTPRSNPATYTGILTLVRDLFAGLPESRARGYRAGRYSFNIKGGRCEACQGDGVIRIEMSFLPDVYVGCEVCKGARYNRETLEVRFKGANIAEVLAMTVDQALALFANVPKIRLRLETLRAVGLGYLTLGQSATTLSGGEAQRLKLSRELSRHKPARSTPRMARRLAGQVPSGRTLFILDEPTTGLHFDDIEKLLAALDMLVSQGNTVVVIEHNLDVIKTADRVIDLGPEGGDAGGELLAAGTPEQIAASPRSVTGRFLAPVLKGRSKLG